MSLLVNRSHATLQVEINLFKYKIACNGKAMVWMHKVYHEQTKTFRCYRHLLTIIAVYV